MSRRATEPCWASCRRRSRSRRRSAARSTLRDDAPAFHWIGRVNSNVEVQQTWHTAAVKTIADAQEHEVVVGGTGPESSSVVFPRILNAMFGMKFKVVAGYEGVNMVSIAVERGEVEGMVRPWAVDQDRAAGMAAGAARSISWCNTRSRAIRRSATCPRSSTSPATEEQRQVLSLYASGSDIGRSIVAPPGVRARDRVAALRTAFSSAMRDSGLIADVRKSGLDIDALAGERLQAIVGAAVDVPPGGRGPGAKIRVAGSLAIRTDDTDWL